MIVRSRSATVAPSSACLNMAAQDSAGAPCRDHNTPRLITVFVNPERAHFGHPLGEGGRWGFGARLPPATGDPLVAVGPHSPGRHGLGWGDQMASYTSLVISPTVAADGR